jgi:hypothetical protein
MSQRLLARNTADHSPRIRLSGNTCGRLLITQPFSRKQLFDQPWALYGSLRLWFQPVQVAFASFAFVVCGNQSCFVSGPSLLVQVLATGSRSSRTEMLRIFRDEAITNADISEEDLAALRSIFDKFYSPDDSNIKYPGASILSARVASDKAYRTKCLQVCVNAEDGNLRWDSLGIKYLAGAPRGSASTQAARRNDRDSRLTK